jgi:general secretion pathway protein M
MMIARLEPYWARGAGWWNERSQREQILLGALAALVMAALLLVLVIRPLEAARTRAAANIRTYEMLATRLRAGGPGPVTATRKGTPSQIISDIATAGGLNVQRIEPEGGRLRVVFADASFEAVLHWVSDVERTSPLRISEAQIERSASGSGVAAQFLLAGG